MFKVFSRFTEIQNLGVKTQIIGGGFYRPSEIYEFIKYPQYDICK